jgi:branched-chain amino acid transport system substrate-binding protein
MKKLLVPVAGVALLILSGCSAAPALEASPTLSADKPPITIGMIAPTQGAFAEIGKNITDGFQVAIDQVNANGGVAGGSELVLEIKDEGTSPQTATQAARDFTSAGVNLLGGLFSSADCGAVAPVIEESPAILVTASCASDSLTGGISGTTPFERTFGVAVRDKSNAEALAQVIAKEFPKVTTYDAFAFDYNWGHETWETFRDGLKADGVKVEVNSEQFVPLGTSDFRAQVAALSGGLGGTAKTRGILLATFGGGTAGFLKQAEAYDLPGDVAVIANAGEYYNVARSLEGAAPDVWNVYDYNFAAFDNDLNTAFVTDYGKLAGGANPVGWTYQGYLIGLAYAAAIDKAGSGDPDEVLAALEGVSFDSPSGELTMGAESHQLSVPAVISHTVGDPSSPDGVKVIETQVVPYTGK